jgi:hypothetical protein
MPTPSATRVEPSSLSKAPPVRSIDRPVIGARDAELEPGRTSHFAALCPAGLTRDGAGEGRIDP